MLKNLYKDYFLNASVLMRLIAINVVVFVVVLLLKTLFFFFNIDDVFFLQILKFSSDVYLFLTTPWTILTYAFVHLEPLHLLFNMLWLYFFGNLFLQYHPGRRLLNVYILGAVFGGLSYMVAYTFLPAFSNISKSSLSGASAAVCAIMVAITVQKPNQEFRFMFISFSFKLWWITVGFLILDFLRIPSGNAGGHISHLGGAFIGYIYITQLNKGYDIAKPIETTMDWVVSLFSSSDAPKMKTVHKSKPKASKNKIKSSTDHHNQKKIDLILDKISKSGYDSLSKEEKAFLFKAGKR